MRNVLGTIYDDEDFAELFEVRGRPAIAPWRLALVTLMQFSEGLSDRQTAEAVRARIDWKYALGLRLSDPALTSRYSPSSALGFSNAASRGYSSRSCSRDARSAATSRREAASAPTRPTCWALCASLANGSAPPRRCEPPSTLWRARLRSGSRSTQIRSGS